MQEPVSSLEHQTWNQVLISASTNIKNWKKERNSERKERQHRKWEKRLWKNKEAASCQTIQCVFTVDGMCMVKAEAAELYLWGEGWTFDLLARICSRSFKGAIKQAKQHEDFYQQFPYLNVLFNEATNYRFLKFKFKLP